MPKKSRPSSNFKSVPAKKPRLRPAPAPRHTEIWKQILANNFFLFWPWFQRHILNLDPEGHGIRIRMPVVLYRYRYSTRLLTNIYFLCYFWKITGKLNVRRKSVVEPYFFGRLRLRTSEVPEPTPASAKWGRLQLKAIRTAPGCYGSRHDIFFILNSVKVILLHKNPFWIIFVFINWTDFIAYYKNKALGKFFAFWKCPPLHQMTNKSASATETSKNGCYLVGWKILCKVILGDGNFRDFCLKFVQEAVAAL